MDTKQTLERFEEIVSLYRQQLDRYEMDQLTRTPEVGEWSLGQVYVHLIQTTMRMQLRQIEACRENGGPASGTVGEKTEPGKAVFDLGAFPPIRIRVAASDAYTPRQPESKEQLVDGLNEVVRRMREVEPSLEGIPAENTAPHPRLGKLNAKEWFALAEMHFRHHLRQKERLDALLFV
ncbi:DinB family protein [Paenibacillus mesophilus]|nr:DinB family protein [Paenibacillus mesophilus]TMV50992.1 DinB family protein [Paenibacillus mesophilus]